MARLDARNGRSAPGDWFVDTRCIDCGGCRHVAPTLLADEAGLTIFTRQPADAMEEEQAWLGAELCPTQSIGTTSRRHAPVGLYPRQIASGVHLCGSNSRSSYGAHSWFVTRPDGNLLIDSPRATRKLMRAFEARGGIAAVLLSHRDDVADAEEYATHFGAAIYIHVDDARAAPFATNVIEGADPVPIRPGVVMIPVPGHTRGSVVYLVDDRDLFSGDSLAWDGDAGDLEAFADACWYSWTVQQKSLGRLAGHPFEQVFAGHGSWSPRRTTTEMRERLLALVDRM